MISPVTWIVVAHDAGARIFSNHGSGKGLQLLKTMSHPKGRARDRTIDSDRPGRSFQSGGNKRHALSREETPHQHNVAEFARQLASVLRDARIEGDYDRLVLIAAPQFLGVVRTALDDVTSELVIASMPKNLGSVQQDELEKHVGELIAV